MEVVDESWSEVARRRGRRIGLVKAGLGCCSVVVPLLVLLSGPGELWMFLSLFAGLFGANLVLEGYRRHKVESAPLLTPPLALPAVLDPGSLRASGLR